MISIPTDSLEKIKKVLLRQQKEVEENLRAVEQDDPTKATELAETTEPGTDSWIAEGHTRAVALIGQLKTMGKNIRASLHKMRVGTYGKCEKCGNQIQVTRLMVMPTATLCVSCSSKKNKN